MTRDCLPQKEHQPNFPIKDAEILRKEPLCGPEM